MATIKDDFSTNLISYWSLEEESGTRYDAHGSNDLTDNNTVLYGTGIQGNAADLEYSNAEYLSITNAAQSGLDLTGDFSFSCWVNGESYPSDDMPIFSKRDSSENGYSLRYQHGDNRLLFSINNIQKMITTTLTAGNWYHIVVTYDASAGAGKVYVNGSLLSSPTGYATSINTNTTDFALGGYPSVAFVTYWDGLIDEVGIWSTVLSGTDVTTIYNSGSGIPYELASGPANLKSYNTNLKANIKTINGNPIANVKSLNTNV